MEEIAANPKSSEENDSQGEAGKAEFATPSSTSSPGVVPTNTPVSTPDLTPSRRSSRKKQSTFSSDFEYYSIGRKKETPKEEKEEIAEKEDAKPVANKPTPTLPKKVGVRGRPPGKSAGPKVSTKNVKSKVTLKKTASAKKSAKAKAKGKAKEESEEEDDDEEEEEEEEDSDEDEEESDEEEKEVKAPVGKAQKRKKVQPAAKRKKAKKSEDSEDDEQEGKTSNDEDDSTPISQLKAKMVTIESKELATPSPTKKKISVLPPTSPLAKNLMSKLKKASMEVLSSPEGFLSGQKRKLPVVKTATSGSNKADDEDEDEVPLKKLQMEKQEEDEESEPDPLEDAGLVKRSPSEIVKKKTVTTAKTESKTEPVKIEEDVKPQKLTKSDNGNKQKASETQSPKKEKIKSEEKSSEELKKKPEGVGAVKKESKKEEVKKEIKEVSKKEVKGVKAEGSKKAEVKTSPVKKESNVVKKVIKVVKTADGRVIKGEVRILKDGRKVMVIDGKQKVLVTGKDKEKKQAAAAAAAVANQKPVVSKKDAVKKNESPVKGTDKKVVKTPEGKKVLKKEGGKVSPPKGKSVPEAKKKSLDGSQKKIVGQAKAKKVDDLLKRGVLVKKKRHLPFGNKNTVAKVNRQPEVDEKQGKKRSLSPKSVSVEKKERKKSIEKTQSKKSEEGERRKSSDSTSSKSHGRDRSQSSDSSKGDRRKSAESSSKSVPGIGNHKDNEEDAPPLLIAANAAPKPYKHKHHHKPEHDTSMLDMTMNDLFKPDTIVAPKKEHEADTAAISTSSSMTTAAGDAATVAAVSSTPVKEDNNEKTNDADSPIKPQNLPNVLIEHKYSKPTSPADGEAEPAGLEQQDLNSMSIPASNVIADMKLPDQFMEEPESHESSGKTNNEEMTKTTGLQQEVAGNDSKTIPAEGGSGRASILESLDTELQEGGSDFLIVGQVEVERPSSATSKDGHIAEEKEVETSIADQQLSSSSSSLSSTSTEKAKEDKVTPAVKESKGEKSADETLDKPKRKIKVKRQDSSDTDVKEKKKKVHLKIEKPPKIKSAKDGDQKDDEKKEDDSDDDGDDDDDDFVDDENDDDWDDPTTLYCICKKPHGNRFMICCDKCEEWYHGSCVGVTRARGKEMEDNEEEYVCPSCQKGNGATSTPAKQSSSTPAKPVAKSPSTPKPVFTTTSSSSSSSTSTKVMPKLCVGKKCNKLPRSGSVYCSNECVMSHAQDSLKAIREEEIRRKNQKDGSSHKSSSGSKMLSTVESVVVIDKETGKVVQGSAAPSYRNLRQWLEEHPTFQVFLGGKHKLPMPSSSSSSSSSTSSSSVSTLPFPGPTSSPSSSKDGKHKDKDNRSSSSSSSSHHHHSHHHHHRSSSSSESHDKKDDKARRDSKDNSASSSSSSAGGAKKIDGERRRSSSSSTSSSSKAEGNSSSTTTSSSSSSSSSHSKPDEKSSGDGGPNQIRLNVRTALRNSLSARAEGADDIMLSGNEIKNLAMTIEEELYNLFLDTGHKYRTKYRSLVFNIKDSKNKGLFRKILTGKIKPYKLVQMSTEELASRELAKWREKESKHQLEMIEQTEKEALKESMGSKHVRKKTHKGEIEVEEEDLSILEARLDEKVDKTNEAPEELIQVPVIDTTDQHRAHLFDLNCKVCTGKIVPGPEEQQQAASSTKKVTFSFEASTTKIISDDEQSAEPDDFAKAEEIVKEAMRTVQKTSEAISSYSPPPDVSDSPPETNMPESPPPESTSLLSMTSSPKHDSVSSSSSSLDMTKVVVRSPDSALQSGLELKAKFVPTGPLLWKGCISMLDVAKFFTSAYRVSGPFENITIPDTIHIMGRISPDHMWDYLSKIRQAGSKDLTVVRFIPGNDDEKVAYVHLYSYLNSRSRCGVAGSDNSKQIKDFYVIPLASHSKIPRTLLPFDGPGLEENRPHMLIGIIVKQRGKHSSSSDSPSIGNGSSKSKSKSSTSSSSSSSSSSTSGSNSKHHSSDKPSSGSSSSSSKHKSSSSSKDKKPVIVNRDPRLAKLAAAAAAAKPASSASPTDSTSSAGSSHNSSTGTPNTEAVASPSSSSTSAPSKTYGGDPRKAAKKALEEKKEQEAGGGDDIYEPEYVPMPVKSKAQPVAEYVPTAKSTKDKEMDSGESQPNRHQHHHLHHDGHHHDHHHHHQHQHHHHHPPHHHHHHHQHKSQDQEDDSEPYSPGKEAEPYSPSQEAQADEPYDPGDETLMDDSGVPLAPTQQPETATSSSSSSSTSSSLSTLSTTASIKTTTSSSSSLSSSNTLMTATTTTTTTTMDKSSASAPVTSTTTTSHPKQESTQPLSGAITTTAAATTLGEVGKKNKKDGNTEDSSLKASDPVAKGEDSPFCINDCVEKMARSNNPTEISSLMVTALSTASSPEEQQKLLVDLTKRVEERKLQLANLSRTSGAASAGSSTSANASGLDKLGLEANVANISKSADSTTNGKDLSEEVSKIPSPVEDITKDAAGPDSSSSSSSSLSGKQQPKAFGFSFLKTSSKTPPLLTTTSADIFTSDSAKTSPDVDKPLNVPGLESAAAGVEEEKQSASKPQIPHALKALMDDVLGNTQSLHGEKRMKHMIKKETDKEEKRKKEREEEEEGKNEEQQSEKTEAEKRLEDEMEARKILEGLNESEKAIGLPGGGKKEKIETPQSSSSVEEAADVTTDNTKKDKVPTIDELLEKLKKGGFQFPVATAEKTTTASASDDIITPEASSSTSDVSSTTNSTSASTTLPLLMGNLDNQDVDLRTMSGTPPLLSTVTSSMGMTENPTPADTIAACLASLPKNTAMSTSSSSISPPHVPSTTDSMLEVQDIDHRKSQPFASSSASSSPPPNTAIDKDDHFKSTSSVSFYEEDKDDRIFQSLPHAGRPKHPLDPRAFPPLPGDSSRGGGVYPPPHHPSRPSPRFPLPKTGRAQPPPPGTEFESTTMTTGRTASDLPVSDIDMRSGSGSGGHPHHRGGGVPIPPPLPPEQVPPPLPPQPPPPLPPLPGNRGVGDLHHHHHLHHPAPPLPPAPYQDYPPPASNPGYSHLPPSDIDFRGHHHHHEHHPHLPPHHHPQQPQQHHPHHGGSSHHHQHHHHHHPSSSSSSSSSHHPPPSSSSHHSDKPWYQDRGGERGDRNRRDQDYHRRGGGGYSRGGRRH